MSGRTAVPDATELLWARASGLRFRLRDTVSVDVLRYRGREAYLLRDAFERRQFRLGRDLYRLLAKLDGRRTLADVCESPSDSLRSLANKRCEIVTAVLELQEAGLLTADIPPDVEALVAGHRRRQARRQLGRMLRVLSPRFALADPERFLERTFPVIAWSFRPALLLAWLGLVMLGGLQGAMHWNELLLYGAQRLNDPSQWALLVCLYPLIKGLHELGHCYAVKAGGGTVRELGIMLLVFVPVPYVDASAASAFPNKRRRILVGAAGLMVEVFVAALALFVWVAADDGPVRDTAYATLVIGGVSTLLFNANPLLRFDGYYMLADAIEIPDLASRSTRYYGYLVRRYLFGVLMARSPCRSSGERRWFVGYGAAATLYRIGVTVGIALFLVDTIPVLGAVLAVLLLASQLLFPAGRQIRYLLTSPALSGRRVRALSVTGIGLGTLLCASALLPVASRTHVDGVVLLPEHAEVRAGADGFVERFVATDGEGVVEGDALVVLSSPELDAELRVSRARVRELEARRDRLDFGERGEREVYAERLLERRAELEQLLERESALTVRSPLDGVFRRPPGERLSGRFVRQGDGLGYVADRGRAVVRAVATEREAARIREGVERVEVRLAARGSSTLPGRLMEAVPLASDTLPSAVLGSRAGGVIAVDARDERGVTVLRPVFIFDVAVPVGKAGGHVGSRASLRLTHDSEPLLARGYAALRAWLLEEIGR